MTNVVRKGAGRKTHSDRTAKAAQRTPLPPKGATSAPSKSDTAKALKETHEEVKAAKVTKASKAAGKAKETPTATEPRTLGDLLKDATAGGWGVDRTMPTPTILSLVFKRGDEELTVIYENLIVTPANVPTYVIGSRHVKLRNVSAARKQLLVSAEDAQSATVTRTRAPRSDKGDALPADRPRKKLPFDPETATEQEIKDAVSGRRIKWRNTLTGSYDDAIISKTAKQLKVETHPKTNKRMLTFCDTRAGFRTILLERLVSVR